MKSPATTSRVRARASCATTRPRRKRAADGAPPGWPASSLSTATGSTRITQSAGNIPKRTAVASETTAVKGMATGSSSNASRRTSVTDVPGSSVHTKRRVQWATTSPAAPARSASRPGLGQELRQEMPPRGAQREPHRHLSRPGGRAGELQVRDIGARDQEDGAGDAEDEQQSHALGAAAHPGLPQSSRCDLKGPVEELLQRRCAHGGLQRRLDVRRGCSDTGARGPLAPARGTRRARGGRRGRSSRRAGPRIGRRGSARAGRAW